MSHNSSSRKRDSYRHDSDLRGSYQGMPSGMPLVLHHQSAFRRSISEIGVSHGSSNMRKSFARTYTLVALLTLSFASPLCVQAQKPASEKVTADLPAGPMQAKATTACTECHEARIILQQRLSKAAWTKEVDKMIKWGAVVGAADRDALIDYLSTNFSPEKPAYEAPRTAADKGTKRSK
jgi:hypothetical protein